MPATCLPYTELPNLSRLFLDYTYHFDRVSPFYGFSPRESASCASSAAALHYPEERRRRLVDALREQNPGHPALDVLARPGSCVVATGQQVGLFGGPCYAVYKALTAAHLARQLSAQGIPSVPVFWLATEDHDLEEVNHVWVFDGDHHPVRIDAQGIGESQAPVGRIRIGGNPTADLRRALAGLPFGGEVAALCEDAYADGQTFGDAFRILFQKLLSPYGLLLLDPLRPAIRKLAAPLLAQARERAPELVPSVLARNSELEAAGYHQQVHVDSESSLLFLLEGGRRRPLRRQEIASLAPGRAEDLSPNALLRPVVQDYLLPTVATVMGPAEVAYMAQAQVLYRALLGRMPVVVNRASFTLFDARAAKLLARYGLSLADCFKGKEFVRGQIARKLVPPAVTGTIEVTASETAARLEHLRVELASFDPSLAEGMDRSRRKILYQFEKIGRKVAREALRRNQRAVQEADYLRDLLYPHQGLQERLYTILPFLAQHGTGLIDTIFQNIRLDCPDHQLLTV